MDSQARLSDQDVVRAVRANTLILAICLALSWAVVQLTAAVSAVTLSQLTGRTSLGGIAPGIFLASWAVASLQIRRFMDWRGRATGLRAGFTVGVIGTGLVFLGTIR